jgi:hypothetical protein
MYNEDYITSLFVFIDNFLKILQEVEIWKQLPKWESYKSGRKKGLSLSEVITLNILRVLGHFNNLKAFHRNAIFCLKGYFPGLPNYENFLKASNKSFEHTMMILFILLYFRRKNATVEKPIDSTPLPVCKNRRISRHKVCKGIAQRGKTTIGWFYGFKLHGICDLNGNLISIMFTPGNIDDRKVLDKIFEGIEGIIIGDGGYLCNNEIIEDYLTKNIYLFTGVRNNMKKIMTKDQHNRLKRREIIETIWSILKDRLGIVTSLARSIKGLFRHYFYVLLGYCVQNI